MTKKDFIKHLIRLLEMFQRDLQLYDATQGAFDMNNIKEYENLIDSYVSLLASNSEENIEAIWNWLNDNQEEINISNIHTLYDSLKKNV